MKYYLPLVLLSTMLCIKVDGQKKQVQTTIPTNYFPPAREWKHLEAAKVFDTALLQQAIKFAIASESRDTRSMERNQALTFGKEPFGSPIGPFADRGEPTGLIVYKGFIVAEWGEPSRTDMTHSVTKSFLSAVTGLAVDRGLIGSVTDTVYKYVSPTQLYDPPHSGSAQEDFRKINFVDAFSNGHNKLLTWDVMLRQTSDWEGMLWGKPDWADRPDTNRNNWLYRVREKPGAVYEYNDVRVNALSLAVLNVWRKPLPKILKELIMDPIGASSTWSWTGYNNSWVVLDGQVMQSVSGGGHWGGGMFINAYDMARFGLLTLHQGNWNGKQLISREWIQQSLTPTTANPGYGYMNFFLNTNKKYMPHAPATAYNHVGNGTNIIYVDAEHDIVMVVRWIQGNAVDGLVQRVLEALRLF